MATLVCRNFFEYIEQDIETLADNKCPFVGNNRHYI